MSTDQQMRKSTPEEDIRELYKRVARLSDHVAALMNPAWGAETDLLPAGHPLRPSAETAAEAGTPTDWRAVAVSRELDLKAQGEARHKAEQERDGAYRERAHLVALLAAHYPAVVTPAPDVDEPGWQIAYLSISGRQASWHIAPSDADLFASVEHVAADDPRAQWDGHTTAEKYHRIRRATAAPPNDR